MIRAAAEHTTPEGSARKAWHSILYATGAYIYFRQQTGGGCLVVVKLASLVVLCGGHRPPTNATSQCFDGKGHTSNTTCSCPHYIYIYMCVSALSGADGTAREHEMGVNKRPGLIMSHHGMQ